MFSGLDLPSIVSRRTCLVSPITGPPRKTHQKYEQLLLLFFFFVRIPFVMYGHIKPRLHGSGGESDKKTSPSIFLKNTIQRISCYHLRLFSPSLSLSQVFERNGHVNDRDSISDMTLLHFACKAGAAGIGDPQVAAEVRS